MQIPKRKGVTLGFSSPIEKHLTVCCGVVDRVCNKELSYRRETARRSMLVNSCYVSRGMTVKGKFQSAKVTFKVIKVIQGH